MKKLRKTRRNIDHRLPAKVGTVTMGGLKVIAFFSPDTFKVKCLQCGAIEEIPTYKTRDSYNLGEGYRHACPKKPQFTEEKIQTVTDMVHEGGHYLSDIAAAVNRRFYEVLPLIRRVKPRFFAERDARDLQGGEWVEC